jgi:prepilin-type N-terminal cleavage/methylation domain-containing protein
MMPRHTTLSRSRRAGFTLVELMVSLTVGGIAISSIYAVGAASTRAFYQQQQVANAQTTLRMALDQVKRDIARAGYLSTPGATLNGQVCGTVSALFTPAGAPLAGITRFQNDVATNAGNQNLALAPGAIAGNRASGFTADDVVLMANYETSSEYPGVSMVSPGVVSLGANWHAFRRDFTNWYNPVPNLATDADALQRAFAVNRLIRLRLSTNLYHFATITGVTIPATGSPAAITIAFTPQLPADCQAAAGNAWIAPVSAIRYTVRDAAANSLDLERFAGSTGPMAQLVREEVQPGNKLTPLLFNNVPNRRAILDYVVGFNLSFTMNGALGGIGVRDVYDVGQGTNVPLTVNANPERIRSVIIELAVRTPEQDKTFPWSAEACADMRCYQVFSDRPGSARVRRARAEVFVPNIANEGY